MGRALGKVERLILAELRRGVPMSVNRLVITVLAAKLGKDTGIIYIPTESTVYQSTARAVRALASRGIIKLNT